MIQQRLCIALLPAWLSITTAFGIYDAVPTTSSTKSRIGSTAHRQDVTNDRSQLLRNALQSSPPSRRTLELATALEGGYGELPSHATYEKTSEEYAFIKEALLENVLFSNLPESTLNLLILSFEQITVSRGQKILTQGELCDGDYVYLVGGGECTVIVDGKIVPGMYLLYWLGLFEGHDMIYSLRLRCHTRKKADILSPSSAFPIRTLRNAQTKSNRRRNGSAV